MNVSIEKIENGFIVTLGNRKTFCDVPEAVCGVLAEWALQTCEALAKGGPEQDSHAAFHDAMMRAQQQQQLQQMYEQAKLTTLKDTWPPETADAAAPYPRLSWR